MEKTTYGWPKPCNGMNVGPMVEAHRNAAIAGLQAGRKLVYAVRRTDGLIKIGCTRNLVQRLRHLDRAELIGFTPGDFEDERAIHHMLAPHAAEGREVYDPAPAVLAVVNDMRTDFGLPPL